jgi:hypothetical protein
MVGINECLPFPNSANILDVKNNFGKYLYAIVYVVLLWIFWSVYLTPDARHVVITLFSAVGGIYPLLYSWQSRTQINGGYAVYAALQGFLLYGLTLWACIAVKQMSEHEEYLGYVIVVMILGSINCLGNLSYMEAYVDNVSASQYSIGPAPGPKRSNEGNDFVSHA